MKININDQINMKHLLDEQVAYVTRTSHPIFVCHVMCLHTMVWYGDGWITVCIG
jgi:hypothetical protein